MIHHMAKGQVRGYRNYYGLAYLSRAADQGTVQSGYSKHRAGNNKINFWQSEVGHKGSHARVKNDPSRTAAPLLVPECQVGSDVTHPVIQLGKAQALCTFTSIRCVVGFHSHSPPLHHPLSPIIFPSPRMFSLSFSSPLHLEVRVVCNLNKDPPKPFSSCEDCPSLTTHWFFQTPDHVSAWCKIFIE